MPPSTTLSQRPEIGPTFEDREEEDHSLGSSLECDLEDADVLVDPSSKYAFEFFQELKRE